MPTVQERRRARRERQGATRKRMQSIAALNQSRGDIAFMTTDSVTFDVFGAHDAFVNLRPNRDGWTREDAKANTHTINRQERRWDAAQRRAHNALRLDEYRRINLLERLQRRIELRHDADALGYIPAPRERKPRAPRVKPIKLTSANATHRYALVNGKMRKLSADDYGRWRERQDNAATLATLRAESLAHDERIRRQQ